MLQKGEDVPDITLQGTEGDVDLRKASSGTAVFYFYPKDFTSGCTAEAQSFRDAVEDFREAGVPVYGISRDDLKSHEDFAQKHNLNFPLLSDVEGEAVEAFGVESGSGRAKRVTFLVSDGEVVEVFRDVSPEGHAEEVLERVNVVMSKA